ncbi:T9SS type A sorting domain-containing protein [Hymenobacter algoricola]|uniref:Secretion system C-terminal sorting domain-containing protein n=1 Tax=Hymenobacter algoricola TaxID=486267 RepID=A0ABP7MDQ9_9BACT
MKENGYPFARLRQVAAVLTGLVLLTGFTGAVRAQTFGAAGNYTSNPSLKIATGDVNGDGVLDLVTANGGTVPGSLSVLLGNGNGSFQPGVMHFMNGSTFCSDVAIADMNRDGKADLLATSSGFGGPNGFFVLPGNGNGTFQTPIYYNINTSVEPVAIAVADVNGDGWPDVYTANVRASSVSAFINRGDGTFPPGSFSYSMGVNSNFNPVDIAVADMDADGRPDLIVVNSNTGVPSTPSRFQIMLGQSNGSLLYGGTYDCGPFGVFATSVAVADVNGDGRTDLLASTNRAIAPLGRSSNVTVLLANGTGGFTNASGVTYADNDTGLDSRAQKLKVADVNGDGRPDLLTANFGTNNVGVQLGNGNGSFQPVQLYSAGSSPLGLAVGDFNGDSKPDVAVASALSAVTVLINSQNPDLIVSTTTTIPSGTYNSITVTGTGKGKLTGNVVVNGSVTVQNEGSLDDACYVMSGTGTFTLAAGATLGICSAAGITTSGTTGLIQTTGTRSFSSDANYVYNDAPNGQQVTGNGLPAQVRNLSLPSSASLNLSQDVAVQQVLTIRGGANLQLNGQTLTLRSDANGTAMVAALGTGLIFGNTAVVERYISPSLNPGTGYRYFSPPVSGATVAQLGTSSTVPIVNSAYNTSATPATVANFPTVFGYDQSRLTLTNNLSSFDKGWFSPAALADALVVGRGYRFNVPAGRTVSFTGSLINTNAPLILTLARGSQAGSGWHLVGNPYPAPLDYSRVAPADRPNLDEAIYVYSSTGQYEGQYRTYVNNVGNPIVPTAQGFFVRVSTGQNSGTLTLRNSHRVTTPNATPFLRSVAETRPLVQLELRGTTGPTDALYAYAQSGATPGFDSQYDAAKLPNSTGLNLASITPAGELLAIDGRPAFTAGTDLPLTVAVPNAGTYTLTTVELLNLPVSLDAFLIDAVTGQAVNLSLQPTYSFAVTAAQAGTTLVGRFSLHFGPLAPLSAKNGLTAASVGVYPNPAHKSFTLRVPAVSGASQATATLFNVLGQAVKETTLGLSGGGAQTTVNVQQLPLGVYTLRVKAGTTTITKKVVVE